MRYIFKNIQDSDKENAQQLELILNNKSATHDDINGKGFCIQSISPMGMHEAMPASVSGLNHDVMIVDDIELSKTKEPSFPANINPYYTRSYASKDTMELVDAILFQEEKQPKDNHPNGWYRKFEKKRH